MSEVKRFEVRTGGQGITGDEFTYAPAVLASDYEALVGEVSYLNAAIDMFEADAAEAWDTCEKRRLQAQRFAGRLLKMRAENRALRHDIARALANHSAELEAENTRMKVFLGFDSAWPTFDVVAQLVKAVEHLLTVHGCDTHGHELFARALTVAKERCAALAQAAK